MALLCCSIVLGAGCGDDDGNAADGGHADGGGAGQVADVDAGRHDSGVHPHDGCANDLDCTGGTGGPPVNACLAIGGVGSCVYTCSADTDCLAPFYAGCGAHTDDGTKICFFSGSDAGADHGDDAGAADGCTSSGGTVTQALCCAGGSAFPDTCSVGTCSCAPASSHTVDVCDCPDGKCFDGSKCR